MNSEILTVSEMYAADRFAAHRCVPSPTLMENAGRAVADAIIERWGPCDVAVLCGPGNNGGDGFVVARLLKTRGWAVRLSLLGEPNALRGDAAAMAQKWDGPIGHLSPASIEGAGLVVVALFGAGLSRALEGAARSIVEQLNAGDIPVVAIDVPSGLHGDLGRAPDGGISLDADLTVTFFCKKPAHVLAPGRCSCCDIVVADIGIPDSAILSIRPRIFENGPELWGRNFPWPRPLAHKYARGHAIVVSGPEHATGAARLAARAALRVGAGLVSVASPPDAVAVNASALTAVMVKPFAGANGLAGLMRDKRFNAVAIGPGSGVDALTCDLVAAVLASGASAVLDADALTSFKDDPLGLLLLL